MNSYQKLKKENAKLRQEIHILVTKPDSEDAQRIKVMHELNMQQEKAVMFGSHQPFIAGGRDLYVRMHEAIKLL